VLLLLIFLPYDIQSKHSEHLHRDKAKESEGHSGLYTNIVPWNTISSFRFFDKFVEHDSQQHFIFIEFS
jgi:hypothetical protein